MRPIPVGVVGVGALGRHHLRWYHQLPEAQLVGYYDTDSSRGEYASQYGVRQFESLEALAEQVEAVSIVVPTTAHFEVASALIERGIHCLIEKPVTVTMAQAGQLQALADARAVKVAVGHIERFNPAVRALEGLEVRPTFIEGHRLAAFDPRGTDVAVVHDLMIHDIDLVLWLIKSEVEDIQASAVAVVSDKPDIANARLTFANGAVANLTASRISLHAIRKLRIFQKSGYFSLDLSAREADLYRLAEPGTEGEGMRLPLGKSGQDLLYSKKSGGEEDMLALELTSFLKAVGAGGPVAVPLWQGARALEIALEVERRGRESAERALGGQV
jgi:predicted dehydrogenase